MDAERWAQIEQLFHRAVECDVEERTTLLNEACENDEGLRREVELLLACDASADERVRAAVHGGLASFALSLVGETISHYRILDLLDSGGMGLVYQAEDLKLGRQVALKFLPEESTKDPAALARFEREARSASALEHPNICPIYEFGEHEGRPFLVMQMLEGQTLRELLEKNKIENQDGQDGTDSICLSPGEPLPLAEVLNLSIQIANGLEAAHLQGIIHRDIKPANIFVTHQGQAKILDFGLAKLADTGLDDRNESESEVIGLKSQEIRRDSRPSPTPDPLLSRTGMAMGTAGYMSPEQARGEPLDARTDVFSFGLVLYEMAAGRRAFEGDTELLLHNAILHQAPTPARQLNPEIPARFDRILHKALEKDREIRYQSIAEVRADLQSLHRSTESQQSKRVWLASSFLVAAFLVATLLWFGRYHNPPKSLPEIKFRQLTINSSESPVTSSAISPNGKFLAYVDSQGIHVKDIDSGLTHAIAYPGELKRDSVNFEIIGSAWLPDSTHFLANSHPAAENGSTWSSQTADIWMFSILDEAPRMLRKHAVAWSVSPDGALISFGANAGKLGEREDWLMNSEGQQARKLFDTDENSSVSGFVWSPDSQRGLYIKTDSSGDTMMSRDIHGGPPVSTLTSPKSTQDVRGDISWLPDGRLIYQVADPGAVFTSLQDTCNFWTMKLDMHTGRQLERPKRLTDWTGFCIGNANATADGKRLAFIRSSGGHDTAYVADAETGGSIRNARHFTLEEAYDDIGDWTANNKTLLLLYNRGDHYALYKQDLDSDTPEPILGFGPGGLLEEGLFSPDGKWVIIQVYPGPSEPNRIMRVPIAGGTPQLIFTVHEGSLFFCARRPSTLCAVAEQSEDRKHMVITTFDPVKGRGGEIARLDLDPAFNPKQSPLLWNISPDGTKIASAKSVHDPIIIRSLHDKEMQTIRQRELTDMLLLMWASDGRGLFVTNGAKEGTEIAYVDLQGKTRIIWKSNGRTGFAVPSPDGRHLGINTFEQSSNIWMMENF